MEGILKKEEQKRKLSEISNLVTEIAYSSDSDCEYRIIRTVSRLKRNKTNTHFGCNYCLQRFLREENLQLHKKRHHPEELSQEITIVPDIISIIDNKFSTLYDTCKLCKESYISIDIANHIKTCPELNNASKLEFESGYEDISYLEEDEEIVKSKLKENYDSYDDDDDDEEMKVEALDLVDVDEEELTKEETGLKEQCNKCGDLYISEQVAEHVKVCPAFNKKVNDTDIRIGLDPTMERCHKCNEIYVLAEIEEHVKICKEVKNVTFDITSLCPICGKIFQTHKLKGHMKVHGEKTFLCTICGKGCVSSTALKVHVQSHTKEYRHECDLCKKKFSTRHTLKEHLRIHTGVKEFACELCPKSFTQQNGLKQHMVHCHTGVKKLTCDYCDKRFHKNSDLREHLKVHTKERSYGCDVCGSLFIHSGSLRKHKRKFHSDDLN